MTVSVIVPFFNALPLLEPCAASLRAALRSFPDAEVLFADAASDDGSVAFLARHYPEFRIVPAGSRSPYVARNRAAGVATGAMLAFTDADCLVGDDWLPAIVQAARRGADLVTGPVVPPEGVSATLRGVHDYENARMEALCRGDGTAVPYAYTNNLAVRADLFRELGGFDERRMRGSDSAFVLDALASGQRTLAYEPRMRVVHLELVSLRSWWRKKWLYGRSGTARHSAPSTAALREAGPAAASALTAAALGIGRLVYVGGRLARGLHLP